MAICLVWLAIVGTVGFLSFAVHDADQIAIRSERKLVENSMNYSKFGMLYGLSQLATSDEAVEKINNDPDHAFMNGDVGDWVLKTLYIPTSMVIDRSGRVVYYQNNGTEQDVAKAQAWLRALKPLIDQVRAAEKASDYALDGSDGKFKPRTAIDFIRTENRAAVAGVSTIVPSSTAVVPKPGPSALVVLLLEVTPQMTQMVSSGTLIRNVRLSIGKGEPSAPHIDITSGIGQPGAYIAWDSASPGNQILSEAWVPITVAVAILLLASVFVYRAAAKMTDDLVASEARAIHISHHDSLTGLPNRAWFAANFGTEVAKAGPKAPSALLFLDLDRFKDVNDTMGYTAGDQMLIQVGERLQRLVGKNGFVARLSGDEFAVYLKNVRENEIDAFTDRLKKALEEPFELVGSQTPSSASVGIAVVDGTSNDATEITRWADLALNKAKATRRGAVVRFAEELDQTVQLRSQLARDMRVGLKANDFRLVYQPLVNARTLRASGVEALIRWNHPERGPVSPGIFIPIAEHSGLIRDISIWVMNRAFTDSRNWSDLTLSVNVSPIHMKHPEFINDVHAALEETGANPRQICLEITEGVLLDHSETMRRQLSELRRLGFKIVLDDFGTGYSSLSYLHYYSFDRIKIDKSFVQGLDGVMQSPAIVQAVISLSHMSGADVVAEGVETSQQYEFLKEAGCDIIQGYYFFEPLALPDILELTQGKAARDVA